MPVARETPPPSLGNVTNEDSTPIPRSYIFAGKSKRLTREDKQQTFPLLAEFNSTFRLPIVFPYSNVMEE
jgi:hypothetical protein